MGRKRSHRLSLVQDQVQLDAGKVPLEELRGNAAAGSTSLKSRCFPRASRKICVTASGEVAILASAAASRATAIGTLRTTHLIRGIAGGAILRRSYPSPMRST